MSKPTGVEVWVCPVCGRIVGVKNIGTRSEPCSECKLRALVASLRLSAKGRAVVRHTAATAVATPPICAG